MIGSKEWNNPAKINNQKTNIREQYLYENRTKEYINTIDMIKIGWYYYNIKNEQRLQIMN